MATTITAGNATNGAAVSSDNTGILELKTGTGAGTTALTLSTAQAATFAGALTAQAGTAAAPSITFTGDPNTGIYSPGADRIGFAEGGTQVGEFDASGNFLFNSGYGSAGIAYGCRAWVSFDGSAAGTFAGGVSTVTRIAGSTTATVTTTNDHGLITGNNVNALTGVAAGLYAVTVTGAKTFTITTIATTALTAASITFSVNSIRASGNVSSITDIGTGDYMINFSTAMPDANYAFVGTCQGGGPGNSFVGVEQNQVSAPTASALRILVKQGAAVLDRSFICVSIFR